MKSTTLTNVLDLNIQTCRILTLALDSFTHRSCSREIDLMSLTCKMDVVSNSKTKHPAKPSNKKTQTKTPLNLGQVREEKRTATSSTSLLHVQSSSPLKPLKHAISPSLPIRPHAQGALLTPTRLSPLTRTSTIKFDQGSYTIKSSHILFHG